MKSIYKYRVHFRNSAGGRGCKRFITEYAMNAWFDNVSDLISDVRIVEIEPQAAPPKKTEEETAASEQQWADEQAVNEDGEPVYPHQVEIEDAV